MRCKPLHFLMILILFFLISTVQAQDVLTVAVGAGYKRVAERLASAFTAKTGVQVQTVFGNMGQVTAQAKESGEFDFIIGDKAFLDTSDLPFADEYIIGKGRLVAAVARGVDMHTLDDLTNAAVSRIAIPDTGKAVFGHAAREFLVKKGIWEQIEPKLIVVGTVPQVSAYVISGEVDVGFINLTEAQAITNKIGRLLPVEDTLYSPVLIVARGMQKRPDNEATRNFAEFLQSEQAQAICREQGL